MKEEMTYVIGLQCFVVFVYRSHMSMLGTFYYCDLSTECTSILNLLGTSLFIML